MNLRAFFNRSLYRKLAAEALGSALLVLAFVGSGIMGERMAGGLVSIALLVHTLATAAMLFVLIHMFAPISGAHFNPLVTLIETASWRLPRRQAPFYLAAQVGGALVAVGLAHLMFDLPVLQVSSRPHAGVSHGLSECIAAFALLSAILFASRLGTATAAVVQASAFAAIYWFTPGNAFTNPAVTLARALTDTLTGIRPVDTPMLLLAQLLGAWLAWWVYRQLIRES